MKRAPVAREGMHLRETGATAPGEALNSEPVSHRWYHKLGAVAAAVFCFELGVFLLIYPWLSAWDIHAARLPEWSRPVWVSSYMRGAVSGLGLLNLYISFAEVFRLRRFSR
jgi:hypothetical protein